MPSNGWRAGRRAARPGPEAVIYSIAIILVLLWIIALMSSATLGGFIHVLPALAALLVLFGVIGAAAR